ncbi:hypothetical protein pb186bvf_000574 [Paramecium bursaria]
MSEHQLEIILLTVSLLLEDLFQVTYLKLTPINIPLYGWDGINTDFYQSSVELSFLLYYLIYSAFPLTTLSRKKKINNYSSIQHKLLQLSVKVKNYVKQNQGLLNQFQRKKIQQKEKWIFQLIEIKNLISNKFQPSLYLFFYIFLTQQFYILYFILFIQMPQIIQIHIGQAGIQIGDEGWELLRQESNIDLDGKLIGDEADHCIFHETPNQKYVPRAVFIDTEDIVVVETKRGIRKNLYAQQQFLNGKESANYHTRGIYQIGRDLIDETLQIIRHQVEKCDKLDGFIFTKSTNGGTGSGFGSLLTERMSVDYGNGKTIKSSITVMPSPNISTEIIELYNATLSIHNQIEYEDLSICVDNERLYKQCDELDIELPNYQNLNQILSQITSSLTTTSRKQSIQGFGLKELNTNLIPYARLHFLQSSITFKSQETSGIINELFQNNCSSYNNSNSRYLANSILFRGDFSPMEVFGVVNSKRFEHTSSKQVDFVQTGFKIGIVNNPMIQFGEINKKGAVQIQNSLSIDQQFVRIAKQFDNLYARRAFIHWYVMEGMEESEMSQAREDMAELIKDYRKCSR